MSKKQEFIEYVEAVIRGQEEPLEMTENVRLYWEAFKGKEEAEKPLFTDNGKLILQHMKDNQNIPMWKAKDVAEGLFISSRAVSGAMRKLVTDGYVEKVGQDPVVYTLTEKGINIEII
jgi:DNA-binding MarR family transcriptional regulator